MSYDYETPLWEQYENEQNIKKQEQQAEPASTLSAQEAEQMGIIQPAENTEQDKVENPELNQDTNSPQYKKLSVGNTMEDIGASVGVEALHFLQPKSMETQYQSQTRIGETLKQVYRWGIGFVGLGKVGWGIKALTAVPKIANAGKIGAAVGKGGVIASKALGNEALVKTGSSKFLKKFGVGLLNTGTQGAAGGTILDWNLNDLDDPHVSDMFGASDNPMIQLLQSDPDDSDWQIRAKNVVEGLFINAGINGIGNAVAPLLKSSIKGIKALKEAKTTKEVEELMPQLLKDEVQLDNMSSKAELLSRTKEIYNQAIKDNTDGEEILKEVFPLNDLVEAKDIYKKLSEGEDFTMLPDGTLSIKVSNWEDAYKVSKEQYSAQLEPIEAIEHQNEAVKHTWTNRGWIGENEELTAKNANKITKNYKDKWELDNNIKVEFIDGLTVDGKAVEGNTSATKYLGKNKPTSKQQKLQNTLDKKNLQIQKLESKLKLLGTGAVDVDTRNKLIEEIRIAKNEAGKITNEMRPKEKFSDITIRIDKNSEKLYVTLRSELEHARDIARSEVPKGADVKGSGTHFSRYKGDNEGEIAPSYTYKKSVGRAKKVGYETTIENIDKNVAQYKADGYSFKNSTPLAGAGDKRYELKNSKGEALGYVEYTVKDGTLEIGEIRNQTKRIKNFENGEHIPKKEGEIPTTPDVAKKLIDKVISENSNLKIKWDAVTSEGINFKKKYLKQHPELAQNMSGISNHEELDTLMKNEYDTTKGVSYATGNISKHGSSNAGAIREANTPNDRSSSISNSAGKSISKQDGDLVQGNTRANPRGKITHNDASPEQLDLNTKIEAAQTADEIVDGIVNGEFKVKSTADVETIIKGIIKVDPTIKDTTFKSLTEDANILANSILANDKDIIKGVKQAIAENDPKKVKDILINSLALEKVIAGQFDKLNNKNLSSKEHLETLETMSLIKAYNQKAGSAAGGFCGAQNLMRDVNNVFSNASLTSLSAEGIVSLTDILDREIKRIVSLDFTYEQGQKELVKSLMDNPNTALKELLMSNSKLVYDLKNVFDSALKAGKNLDRAKLEEMVTDTIVSHDVQKAIDNIKRCPDKKSAWRTISNGIKTYYITNLLSGFATPFKNACSGLMNTMVYPAEKVLAGACLGGGKELMNEGLYTYKGMVKSMAESLNLMNQAWIKGEGSLAQIGQTLEGADIENWMKPFQEGNDWKTNLGNSFTIMSRVMMATDEFIKQLNYRSIARGKAYTQALEAQEHNMLGDKTVDDLAEEILNSRFYDANGGVANKDILYEANQVTYQTDLSGKMVDPETGNNLQMRKQTVAMNLMGHLNNASNKFLPLKIMFPFLRTGTNILQSNLDHNFIYEAGADVFRFISKEQELKLVGKGREAAMTRARCAFGFTSVLTAAVGLATMGLVTGSPPTDSKERAALFETGWKPYSWNIGGKWISYQGYEPIQTWLGFAADSYRMVTETIDAENDAKMITFMNHLGQTVTNNFIDKAAFRTGINQLNWLFNPDTQRQDGAIKVLGQMASGFLPASGFVKNISSSGVREVTQPTGYERIFNMYGNRGLGDYRRDVFGNRQDIFGAIVTTASANNYDMPEYQELARLGMSGFQAAKIGDIIANHTIGVKEFKNPQTGKSLYDYMQDKLSTITLGGKTLQESVRDLVQDPYYQYLIDGTENLQVNNSAKKVDYTEIGDTKASMLRDLFIEYNNYAKEEALFDCKNYVNKKGQNIEEVQQQIMLNTKSKMINQNLNNTVDKIRSLF